MADNASLIHIEADVSDLKRATNEMKVQFEQMEKTATSTFHNADDVINKVTEALKQQLKQLDGLSNAWKEMGKAQTDAITSRLDTIISRMGSGISSSANQASTSMQNMGSRGAAAIKRVREEQTMLQKGFDYLKWTVTRVFFFGAVLKFGDAIKGVVKEGKEWERQVSALSNLTGGDIGGAKAIYNMIGDLANTVPYEVDEIVKSALTLNKTGLEPTESLLMSIAKIASGTQQSMFTQATALSSVVTGNLRGLRQMGITAKDNGNTLSLTFQGETTEIAKTNKALVAYIENLANTKFNTSLELQMNSLTGKTKVLSEKWAEFSRALYFNGGSAIVGSFLETTTETLTKFIDWLNKPETTKTIMEIWDSVKGVFSSITDVASLAIGSFGDILSAGIKMFDSLVGTTDSATNNMGSAFGSFGNLCTTILDSIAATAKALFKWINDMRESDSSFEVKNGITENLSLATISVLGEAKQDTEKLKKAEEAYTDAIMFKSVKEKYEKLKGEVKQYQKAIDTNDYSNVNTKTGNMIADLGLTDEQRVTAILKEKQEKLKEITKKATDYYGTLEESIEALGNGGRGWLSIQTNQTANKALVAAANAVDVKGVNDKLNYNNDRFKSNDVGLEISDVLNNINEYKDAFKKSRAEAQAEFEKTKKEQEENLKSITNLKTGNTTTGEGQEDNPFGVTDTNTQAAKSRIAEVRDTWTEYYNRLVDSNSRYQDRYSQLENDTNAKIAEMEQKASENSFVTAEMKNQALLQIERDYQEQYKQLKQDANEFVGTLDEDNAEIIKLQSEYQNKLDMLEQYHNEAIISEEQYQIALQQIKDTYSKKITQAQIAQETKPFKETANALKTVSDGFSNLTSNLDENSAAYAACFAVQKSFAVASATANAVQAWMSALSDPTAVTWPQKLANYASAIALTTQILSELASISMHDKGGSIPSGGLGIVGEYGPELISGPANVTSRKTTEDLLSNSKSNITVNLIEDSSRAGQVEQTNTDEETIINVIVANIRSGGDVDGALTGTYGLSRQGA